MLGRSFPESSKMFFKPIELFSFSNQFGDVIKNQAGILVIRLDYLCYLVILLRLLLIDLIINRLIIVTD
jgi:hypothetical protein